MRVVVGGVETAGEVLVLMFVVGVDRAGDEGTEPQDSKEDREEDCAAEVVFCGVLVARLVMVVNKETMKGGLTFIEKVPLKFPSKKMTREAGFRMSRKTTIHAYGRVRTRDQRPEPVV